MYTFLYEKKNKNKHFFIATVKNIPHFHHCIFEVWMYLTILFENWCLYLSCNCASTKSKNSGIKEKNKK